jgi:hypothetical protein
MSCPYAEVTTAGFDVGWPFAGGFLPRGALVEPTTATCEPGSTAVVVRSVHPTYGEPVPVGTIGCLPTEAVGPTPPLCEGAARPIPPDVERGIAAVRAAWESRFGPLSGEVPWTDWGFVGLPVVALDDAAIAAERAREHLDTPERVEKGWVSVGPTRDGVPVYAHFLGSDAPGSDLWGEPDAIVAVLDLTDRWWTHCTDDLGEAPARCTLQLGDIAWFNPVVPDPLGHRDHHTGRCVDVRLFRTDGGHYEAWWNQPDDRPGVDGGYDRDLTRAFLAWTMASTEVTTAFFGDPEIGVAGVEPKHGHDDHVHLCFGR